MPHRIVGRLMDSVINAQQDATAQALRAGAVTLASLPAAILAVLNQETFALVGGIACGTCAFLWMLKSTGENLMIKSLLARIKAADEIADGERKLRVESETKAARASVHAAELEQRTDEFLRHGPPTPPPA